MVEELKSISKGSPMSFTIKVVIGFLLVFGMAGGAIYYYYGGDDSNVVVFRTAQIQKGDLMASISANGTLEPEELVDVGAQVGGQILEFGKDRDGKSIDYGSVVSQGSMLARIDDFTYTIELLQSTDRVGQAKASLKKAEADAELAKAKHFLAEADWERAKKMLESNTLSMSSYDSYKSAFNMSRASMAVSEAAIAQVKAAVSEAENSLNKARQNLSYCIIKSPVDGVVIDRRVNIGQTVVSSLNAPSLFLIAKDLRKMQVWAAVNEADIGKIHPGQPVSFTVSTFPGEQFKGEVRKVRLNATMTQNIVTYVVEISTDNSSGRLLPFLTAAVKFELNRIDNVLMAPNAALRWMPKRLDQIDPEFRNSFSDASGKLAAPKGKDEKGGKEKEGEKPKQDAGSPSDRPGVVFKNGILWMKSGEYIKPFKVKVGLTDGVMSEVIAEGIEPGMEVILREQPKKTVEMVSTPFSAQGSLSNRRK